MLEYVVVWLSVYWLCSSFGFVCVDVGVFFFNWKVEAATHDDFGLIVRFD
jgi:hypothetical protein